MKRLFGLVLTLSLFSIGSGALAQNASGVLAQCSGTGTVSLKTYVIKFKRVRMSQSPRGNAFYVIETHYSGAAPVTFSIDMADVVAETDELGNLTHLQSTPSSATKVFIRIAGRASRVNIELPATDPRARAVNNLSRMVCTNQ